MDPEIGMDIIQLGLVRDVQIENDIARMKMILTTPFCPSGPAMIEMTKAKAVEGLFDFVRLVCFGLGFVLFF